jgi:transposase-like protein
MSRRYTPEEKAEALALLHDNNGNIARTHVETNIPERTLRYWRRQQWLEKQAQLPLPPPTPSPRRQQEELPEFENTAEALKFLREQITQELLNITVSFKDDLTYSTPYQRVLILSQLLDRLLKLDTYLPAEKKSSGFKVQFVNPDGTYWDRDDKTQRRAYKPSDRWLADFHDKYE